MDITHYIKKATQDIRLTDAERGKLFSVIQEYQLMKPLRSTPAPRHMPIFMLFGRPLAASLAMLVVFTGGMSYAAESALPGEVLYPVKTAVTEPLRLALATTIEQRASVEISLAERRIAEAAELAAEDKLLPEMQEDIALAFEGHAQRAATLIEEVDAEDASASAELSSRFETKLAANEGVLARVHEHSSQESSRLSDAIHSAGMAVASIRTRTEQRVAVSTTPESDVTTLSLATSIRSTGPAESDIQVASTALKDSTPDISAASRMRTAAERQIKLAQKSLKSSSMSKENRAQAEAELAIAASQIDEGKKHLTAKEPARAFHAFQQSLVTSEKIQVVSRSVATLKKAKSRTDKSDERARLLESQEKGDALPLGDSFEQTATLSLPAANNAAPNATSNESKTESKTTNPAAATVRIEAAIPPSSEIFAPVQNTITGLIRGASTTNDKDDDTKEGGNKGTNKHKSED